MTTTLDTARAYLGAGFSVVPIRRDGSKAPDWTVLPTVWDEKEGRGRASWKPFTEHLPDAGDLGRWYGGPEPRGIGLIGGAVSGALEQLDFDREAQDIFPAWCALVEEECPGLVARLSVCETPRRPCGYHVRYRCPDIDIPGNSKLAIEPHAAGDDRVLIETRGEGGYCVVPGSPAECHSTHREYLYKSGPELPPVISPDERETLLRCARSFTREVKQPPRQVGLDLRPGDDYDRRGPDWAEILEPAGWCCVGHSGEERRWRRPGKEVGWSATTGHCHGQDGADLLRVFSSNAAPFEDGKAYGKFRALALLRYHGDLSAAAEELAHQGYGSRRTAGPAPGANGHARENGQAQEKVSWPPPIPASLLKLSMGQPWLWDGYIAPCCITLLSSLWKAGKTTLLAHLLKAFETGGEFCGRKVQKGRVLYVTEESEHRWAKRRDLLILADNVSFLVRPFRGRPAWEAWTDFVAYVAEWLRANPVELVVFDPLVNLWPVRDENDNAQVLSALLPLYGVAERSGLLLAHHVRKGDGTEATASRGAGSLMAFVDTIIELRRYQAGEHTDRRRVLTGYGRDDDTPDELVIELSDLGYATHGDRGEVSLMDMLPTIAGILPDEPPGWTRNEVFQNWPEGKGKPNTNRLIEALHRGASIGSWTREGDGKRGSPWRFYRPSTSPEED